MPKNSVGSVAVEPVFAAAFGAAAFFAAFFTGFAVAMALLSLHRVAHDDDSTVRARNGTLHEEQSALGIGLHPTTLLVPPLLFLIAVTFASIALIINALASGYDFFTYYMTLLLTPMVFVSGVYYPTTQLPAWLQLLASYLPLSAAVHLVRPLILGHLPEAPLAQIAILLAYCAIGYYLATVLTRRRLLK